MKGYLTSAEILNWRRIIYLSGNNEEADLKWNRPVQFDHFIKEIALKIYQYLQKQNDNLVYRIKPGRTFNELNSDEKRSWIKVALIIPEKLCSLNILIKSFTGYCRTCIITDREIEQLNRIDHSCYVKEYLSRGWKKGSIFSKKGKTSPVLASYNNLPEKIKKSFSELNCLIPVVLKKAGFEIVRAEEIAEIDEKMVRKIARAMHSAYLHEIRNQAKKNRPSSAVVGFYPVTNDASIVSSDFDDLSDEIKFSNFDNAYHIPAKLLSIGYKIRPALKGSKPVALHLDSKEIETMAEVEHIRWCWDKRLNGWTYGKKRDDKNKYHPGLLPFEKLKETEKEKDRELVRMIPSLLQDIGYVAYPVNPDRIKNLSYAIKPLSSIHRILAETTRMNRQIRSLVTLSPDIDKMVEKRNRKIEEAIIEVEENYNYARHIQETFLPDNLYIRECFPESFILYKPKDIVSGDFYFFSKLNNKITFAAADCTGHGIPGALLSTIGYGILDQAVNEIRLTDPSEILEHLYSKIHRFLRSEEGSGVNDDMDIALCILDAGTNILLYSGHRSPFYRLSNGRLTEYRTDISSTECEDEGKCRFTTSTIQLKRGDHLYLFSDGYTDQFGGEDHKKYLSSRFKSLLAGIHQRPMAEQGDFLLEEIEKWRDEKDEEQTDDILVIGITV